ncbi:hypothetical protein KSP39_PZI001915 [Platanthera zijinensis]|uniref:Uncharacterized protein n=1 Tax=Platanthera zijinensis TaxID=2320716 RepID=A0AAP0C0B3_9ASPA
MLHAHGCKAPNGEEMTLADSKFPLPPNNWKMKSVDKLMDHFLTPIKIGDNQASRVYHNKHHRSRKPRSPPFIVSSLAWKPLDAIVPQDAFRKSLLESQLLFMEIDKEKPQETRRSTPVNSDKKAAVHAEIERVTRLPANSNYAVHRLKMLNKILNLISVQMEMDGSRLNCPDLDRSSGGGVFGGGFTGWGGGWQDPVVVGFSAATVGLKKGRRWLQWVEAAAVVGVEGMGGVWGWC